MSLTSIIWLLIVFAGFLFCFAKNPFYGLLTYIFVYFLAPTSSINWWAATIPDFKWSLLSAVILLISCFIHKEKLSEIKLGSIAPGKWLIAFLVLSVFVSFFAVNQEVSFRRCNDLFRIIIIFYIIIKCIKKEQQLEYTILLILLCGFFLGYQAYNTPRYGGRLEGVGTLDTSDANDFALLLATIIPFGFPLLFSANKYIRYSVIPCFAFIFNGIVLCNSRGAILSIAVSGFVTIFLVKIPKLKIKIIVAGIICVCAFAYLADDVFWERFETITKSAQTDKGSGRLTTWLEGLQIAKDYPFGAGGDGFQVLSPYYITNLTEGKRSAHNTYLLVLVEQGTLGLIVFLCLNFNVLIILRKGRKLILSKRDANQIDESDRFLYLTNIALSAALAGHLTGAIFVSRLYYGYYYFIISLCVATTYLAEIKSDNYKLLQKEI